MRGWHALCRIDARAALEQHVERDDVASLGQVAHLARGLGLVKLELGARRAKDGGDAGVALANRIGQRRASPAVERVDDCVVLEEELDDVALAARRREVEARALLRRATKQANARSSGQRSAHGGARWRCEGARSARHARTS